MSLSTFLNGRDPDRLRGLLWLSLSDTGTRLTLTSTDDAGGGASRAWGTASAVPCRIDPLSPMSGVIGGRIDERSTHLVTVAPGGTVASSDRFVIAGRGTFEVTVTREQTSELSTTFEVIEIS
jgi:hypothetical protein